MIDASGQTTYVYDPKTDRLTSKQTPFGTIAYVYDNAGDVTSIASSNTNGAAMAYQYDQLNRLASVTVAGQAPTLYNYDAVGNLSGYSYPNGVTTSFQYDQLNRLTELGSQGPQGAVASYAYTLGQAGNRTGVTELSGRTVSYGYDNLYRLTSETIANAAGGMNGALGYVYDSVGNRKTLNSTLPALVSGVWYYDANDRTTGITGDTYDADGNTIWRMGVQNSYDFENHLVQHGGMTFVYDGDGNRVAKTAGGVTTSYLVDTLNPTGYAQVLDELQSSSVTRSYAYGLELISESQLTDAAPPASPWMTSWYGYDGHGSVRYLTDSTGAVTDTYDYDAFGNLIASTGSTPNLYLFAGEQFDPYLGLYYNRARYLDTRLGRFWGMDTWEDESQDFEPLSQHKYLYANGDPVNKVDPSGNDAVDALIGAISSTLNSLANILFRPSSGVQAIMGACNNGSRDCTQSESASVLAAAEKWTGTRYLYGGSSRRGIDCSHLVYQAIVNSVNPGYPYTSTSAMAANPWLRSIPMSQMWPGDVMLFKGHTGFYGGTGTKTLFSATSHGVRWANPSSWGTQIAAFRVRVPCKN